MASFCSVVLQLFRVFGFFISFFVVAMARQQMRITFCTRKVSGRWSLHFFFDDCSHFKKKKGTYTGFTNDTKTITKTITFGIKNEACETQSFSLSSPFPLPFLSLSSPFPLPFLSLSSLFSFPFLFLLLFLLPSFFLSVFFPFSFFLFLLFLSFVVSFSCLFLSFSFLFPFPFPFLFLSLFL